MNSNTIRGSAYESVLYWKRASVRTTHLQIQSSKDITGVRLKIATKNPSIRGGSWFSPAGRCRCAMRLWNPPGSRNCDVGFRLAIQS